MAKSVTSELIMLGSATAPGRFSFFRGFKPKAFRAEQKPRFENTILLDPTNAVHRDMLKLLNTTAKGMVAKVGLEWADFEEGLCFGNGDKGKKSKYEGYKGHWWVSASAQADDAPQILDRGARVLVVDAQGREPKFPYSGCWGIMAVTLWLQDNEYGKRINANFKVAQFVKDDKPFSNVTQVDVSQHFQAMEDTSPSSAGSAGGGDDFLN
jgi:hypothetical protein